jgi:hypothetical protein
MKSLFEQVIFREAPEDETPPADAMPADDAPPDTGGGAGGDLDAPPDIDDAGFGDDAGDELGGDSEGEEEEVEISEKISLVMNANLYQRFLTLLNTVTNQLASLKGGNDIIYAFSPKALETIEPLGKLGDNIRLYLSHNFLDSNYSKNLLFYNKCLNLLKLLNETFSSELKKGKLEE